MAAFLIGLTGPIGAGKSTVRGMLVVRGANVIVHLGAALPVASSTTNGGRSGGKGPTSWKRR